MDNINDNRAPVDAKDERRPPFFWIDHEIVTVFMPYMNHYAFSVYALLSHYANHKTNQAFPSIETMARKLDCAPNTIRKAISELKDLELIKIEQNAIPAKNDKFRYFNNVYTLLDVQAAADKFKKGTAPDALGTAPDALPVLHQVNTNKKNINKNQSTKEEYLSDAANADRSDDPFSDIDDLSKNKVYQQYQAKRSANRLASQNAQNAPQAPTTPLKEESGTNTPQPRSGAPLPPATQAQSATATKPPKEPKAPREKGPDLSRYDKRMENNKPRLTDTILRALAVHVFETGDSPLAITGIESRLRPIMFGQKNPYFVLGLIESEQDRNQGKIDYADIAAAVPEFMQYVRGKRLLPGQYQSPKNFITYWQQYRAQGDRHSAWVPD